MTLLAWHRDPDLKAEVLAKLKEHRAQDEFVQGRYLELLNREERGFTAKYRGCAIGCTLAVKDLDAAQHGRHRAMELYYGIPFDVATLIDRLFERQPTLAAAGDFAVAVVENIAPGAYLDDLLRMRTSEAYPFGRPCTCPRCLVEADIIRAPTLAAARFLDMLATAPIPEPAE